MPKLQKLKSMDENLKKAIQKAYTLTQESSELKRTDPKTTQPYPELDKQKIVLQ